MKKADLSKFKVLGIDGNTNEYNLAEELSQFIYHTTQSVGDLSFALDLYKNPIIELNVENKEIIERYVNKGFKAYVQVAVKKMFEGN